MKKTHQALFALVLLMFPILAHADGVIPLWWGFLNGFILLVIISFFIIWIKGDFKKAKKDQTKKNRE